ncbi:MAG: NAD(P)/FAD-dependent oxidoreductase [Candidatus Omnitrophica bacterium]|nr:NAD(P)/FAD-dependent oxidoreductase [Candidatus Omnitrophota bacterium]
MDKVDVIVIGAGIGGLTSALLLARQGVRVALIEKQPYAGGCCSSFTASGYTFDACVDSIGGLGQGEALRRIMEEDLGIWDKVKFYDLAPIRRNFFPDFTIDIPVGLKAYEEALARIFPVESNGIRQVLQRMEGIYQASTRSMLGESGGQELIGYINMSLYDFLSSSVTDKRLHAVLSSYCTFLGVPADEVSAVIGANILMHYVRGGAFRVEGGFQKLADVMVEEIRRAGGDVSLGDAVISIDNRAGYSVGTGVGRRIEGKFLLSNIALAKTLAMMGRNENDRSQAALPSAEVSGSFVLLYLGLKGDLASSGIGSSAGYFGSYAFDDMLNGGSGAFAFGVSIPSLMDSSAAPAGHSALIAHWPTGSVRPVSLQERQRIAGQMLDRLEQAVPGIRERVVYQSVSGPDTIERYTGNTAGAAYGWRQGRGLFKNLTALRKIAENFHIVGHWSGYGGGVMPSMLSACRAANTIIKQEDMSHG